MQYEAIKTTNFIYLNIIVNRKLWWFSPGAVNELNARRHSVCLGLGARRIEERSKSEFSLILYMKGMAP